MPDSNAIDTRRNGHARWFALVVLTIAAGIGLAASQIFLPVSNAIYDGLSKTLVTDGDRGIVVVAIDDHSIDRLGRWPWPRGVHAQLIRKLAAAHPKAIIYDVLFTEPSDPQLDRDLAGAIAVAPHLALPVIFEVPGPNGAAYAIKRPLAILGQAGAKAAHSNVAVDADGVLRSVALSDGGLAYIGALVGAELKPSQPQARIAFARRGSFVTLPAAALLEGEVPPAFLKDKIVIVGATAGGLGDRYATPVSDESGLTPGVETIANVSSGIMTNRLITNLGLVGASPMLALVLVCMAVIFRRLRPAVCAVVAVLLMIACLAVSLLFLRAHLWVDPTPAILSLLIFFPVWGWYRLAAASTFIDRQVERLSLEERTFVGSQPAPAAIDLLAWRSNQLEQGIDHIKDLKSFIETSFESLPDATLVVSAAGRIVMRNAQAQELFLSYTGKNLPLRAAIALRWLGAAVPSGNMAASIFAVSPPPEGAARELIFADDRSFVVETSRFFSRSAIEPFQIIRFNETTTRRRAERDRQEALEFLSHDFRAPQATLIGMIAQHGGQLDPPVKADLERLARRTLDLAQSFVDIARARSDVLALAPIDAGDIFRDSVELHWTQLRRKHVDVDLIVPDEGAFILGEPLLLARAFENLLQNAIRYAPPNSALRVRVARRILRTGEDVWACTIDDRGPGMDRTARAKLFRRFESGARATGGTGLGLSLVKAVCDAFGGFVKCASKTGVGTRFRLVFPALPDHDIG